MVGGPRLVVAARRGARPPAGRGARLGERPRIAGHGHGRPRAPRGAAWEQAAVDRPNAAPAWRRGARPAGRSRPYAGRSSREAGRAGDGRRGPVRRRAPRRGSCAGRRSGAASPSPEEGEGGGRHEPARARLGAARDRAMGTPRAESGGSASHSPRLRRHPRRRKGPRAARVGRAFIEAQKGREPARDPPRTPRALPGWSNSDARREGLRAKARIFFLRGRDPRGDRRCRPVPTMGWPIARDGLTRASRLRVHLGREPGKTGVARRSSRACREERGGLRRSRRSPDRSLDEPRHRAAPPRR
jgi:hypothetical protein